MPTINLNDRALYYEQSGPEGAPPVVLSNSIGTTLAMWDAPSAILSQHFHLLRYDTRGHGRSGKVRAAATIDDLADDIAALMDALGIASAHMVGLSLGGMTVQAFATRYPERTRSVSLLATACHLAAPGRWKDRCDLIEREGMQALVDGQMARWFTDGFVETHPEEVALRRTEFLAIDPEAYSACWKAIGVMDLRERIKGIGVPALILVGADDTATTPNHAEEIRWRIPNADMVVLSKAAHMLAVESPSRVVDHLLPFLVRSDVAWRAANRTSSGLGSPAHSHVHSLLQTTTHTTLQLDGTTK